MFSLSEFVPSELSVFNPMLQSRHELLRREDVLCASRDHLAFGSVHHADGATAQSENGHVSGCAFQAGTAGYWHKLVCQQ